MKRLLNVFGSTRTAVTVISQKSVFFGNMRSSAVMLCRMRNEKVQKTRVYRMMVCMKNDSSIAKSHSRIRYVSPSSRLWHVDIKAIYIRFSSLSFSHTLFAISIELHHTKIHQAIIRWWESASKIPKTTIRCSSVSVCGKRKID